MKKKITNIPSIAFLVLSIVFIYGKYFVETTEIGKIGAGIMALLLVILAVLFYILDAVRELKK